MNMRQFLIGSVSFLITLLMVVFVVAVENTRPVHDGVCKEGVRYSCAETFSYKVVCKSDLGCDVFKEVIGADIRFQESRGPSYDIMFEVDVRGEGMERLSSFEVEAVSNILTIENGFSNAARGTGQSFRLKESMERFLGRLVVKNGKI